MRYFRISIVLTTIIVILTVGNRPVLGAKILAFFPLPIYSHFSGFNPLFLELANRGHNVTVLSPFSPKENSRLPSTYTHFPIPNGEYLVTSVVLGTCFFCFHHSAVKRSTTRNPMDHRNSYRVTNMKSVKWFMSIGVRRTLVLKETQEFLNSTEHSFDLVLTSCWYTDVFLAVGHRYSAPVVCLSPMLLSATISSSLGAPINPSFVPSYWLRYSDVMTFAERLYNTAMTWTEILWSDVMHRSADQAMLDELYTYSGHRDCPPLKALIEAVPLTLVNSHYSVSYARPYPPNVVSVAGMHMRTQSSENIDPKFKSLLDGATQGLIYFSFGSIIKMSDLPEREVRVFVESFRKLPQIVLWKWENGTIDNLPDNVYIDKWFPQQYILSHRNCKLFITHGGYHSLVETLNFGLPVIGFPFYTDQYYNMRFVVENGFGIEILLNDLQENVLDDAIRKIQFDLSYKENAQRASKIFLDLPMSALNTAVYWVEYVARHGHDYKPSQKHGLKWYQYFLLDVITVVILAFFLTALSFYKFIKHLRVTFANLKNKKSN